MCLKMIKTAKKIIVWILAQVLLRIVSKVADTSVIKCDEIIFVMDIVSIKITYSSKCANNFWW